MALKLLRAVPAAVMGFGATTAVSEAIGFIPAEKELERRSIPAVQAVQALSILATTLRSVIDLTVEGDQNEITATLVLLKAFSADLQ